MRTTTYQGHALEEVITLDQIIVGDKLFHSSWIVSKYNWDDVVFSVKSREYGKVNTHSNTDQFINREFPNYFWYREVTVYEYVPSQEGDREDDI